MHKIKLMKLERKDGLLECIFEVYHDNGKTILTQNILATKSGDKIWDFSYKMEGLQCFENLNEGFKAIGLWFQRLSVALMNVDEGVASSVPFEITF